MQTTNVQGDDRFRLAVDASPAAMIMVDADGVIEFANAETERMFGYAIFELIGQSIDILVPSRSRAERSRNSPELLRQSERAADGRRARSLHDAQGRRGISSRDRAHSD